MCLRRYTYEYCETPVLLVVRQSRVFVFLIILLVKSILLKHFIEEYYQEIKSVPTLKFFTYKNNTEGYSLPVRTQNISNIKTIFFLQELDMEHHEVFVECF